MRIVGLPIVCLVLLGAIAIKAGTAASRPPDMEPLPNQTTVGSGVPQDTLTKADKLEIAYVRKAVPVDPVTQFAKSTIFNCTSVLLCPSSGRGCSTDICFEFG